jgi:hypothetical protein
MDFDILYFCIIRKTFIKIILLVYNELTLLVRTYNFLEHFDFIENVLVNAASTKKVITTRYFYFLIFIHLTQTYFALLILLLNFLRNHLSIFRFLKNMPYSSNFSTSNRLLMQRFFK